MKCWFSTHIDNVNVSPTDDGIGPTQGQKKTLTRVGIEPIFNCHDQLPSDLVDNLVYY